MTQETKFVSKLRALSKSGKLSSTMYEKVRPTGSLPKFHKVSIPLRPIVSCIKSPSNGLSKHISYLLTPLLNTSISIIKNSEHFIQLIRDITFEPDDIMVSFDIVFLF